MALIVSTTRAISKGGKLKSICDTLVFENEEEGRQYVKKNKQFVFHTQKAGIIHEQHND